MSGIYWNQPWGSIIKRLRPDVDDVARIQSAEISIRHVLCSNWSGSWSVAKVYTGGSYAKGTHAKGHLEFEIVVFLQIECDITREESVQSFVECISRMWCLGNNVRTTEHSVQFRHPSTGVDVDLCFAWPLEGNSAYAAFTDRLQHGRKRRHYLTDADLLRDSSAGVSEQQVKLVRNFVRRHPAGRGAILLAKALKQRFFGATHTYLPSYVLEILVMCHWPSSKTYDAVLRNVFESVRDLDINGIIYTPPGKESYYEAIKQYWESRGVRGARIIDPVNPFMNVASRLGTEDVRRRSEVLLDRCWGI